MNVELSWIVGNNYRNYLNPDGTNQEWECEIWS